MFLKRIELTGFKSFADKTELEFVQGITAVVGPNGSGKSNISDGIRWVLGEQSAKSLRGGNMQDIIFSGSDSRKAVNYGEVSLTLDNADHGLSLDYSEVTVTRRIHRNGDSEYFINKQACRLKDITELFMDTGIGKEAYSIIGQGRIEEILSTRSEDRRAIFEEASGIVKYKSRRKEAQKKMDETENNLLRIHDLITELEDQLDPLREQSEVAQQFKKLKEQLKFNEISMYVVQIDQLHRSWTESGSKLKQLEHDQLEVSTVVNRHDARLEKSRAELRVVEEQLEHLHESLLRVSEEFDRTTGQVEVLQERQKNLTANREQLNQTMDIQSRRIHDRKVEKDAIESKFEEVNRQLTELKTSLRMEEDKLSGVNGRDSESEEQLKAELIDSLNQIAQVRNELKFLEQQSEGIGRKVERILEEKERWTEQREQYVLKKSAITVQMEQLAVDITRIRNEYLALSEKMQKDQQLIEEVQQSIRKWEQKMEANVSRRDTMTEMQNDYDGFMHGVKEVLKSRGSSAGGLRGVHGAVAELLKVPASVEVALETALGGALQHIVMNNETDAREAINFLKKRQLGRATFLPLDVIKGRSINEQELKQVRGMKGFVGVAVDLIQFDAQYDDIARNLLGQIIITEQLEDANRIAASCKYRYRVVTQEGDVVNAGGSMTGGTIQKRGANLLGRQRQIEAMSQEIASTEQQLQQLREQYQVVKKEAAEVVVTLDRLRLEGEQKRIEEQQLKADAGQIDTELNHIAAQLDMYEQDHDGHEVDQRQAAERKIVLEEESIQLELEQARIQEAIGQAESTRKLNESTKEQLQEELTDLKVRTAALAQERASLSEQLQRFEQDMEGSQIEHNNSVLILEQLQRDMETNGVEIVQQVERMNQFQLEKKANSDQIDFKRADRAERTKQLDEEDSHIREQRANLRRIEDQLHQTEVRVNRLDVELDGLLKKLSEEYELSYELAKERYPIPEDVLGTQNLVRDLKREIAQLGEVNLGAIEEFQRVNERFQFLSAQKADLTEAKTTLYQVIRDMNEEMSKRFRTTFDAIRIQFAIVFTRLFGGGRADLVLADPDQLLETGIDIVAQPPGKKLQNLQLLSGGERALTAIALLFAILRIKPVPFCVLDEVEAALDEANVSRFAEYLREFSEDTQFIVVTHRKGTMEEADVLYGVTMEDHGVSKLVSVRLEDDSVSA
ncbi:MAG: chromosome segregation protein SMC [Paenibacillaceae bacterium]